LWLGDGEHLKALTCRTAPKVNKCGNVCLRTVRRFRQTRVHVAKLNIGICKDVKISHPGYFTK
jgi:hypothetical protein